MSEFDQTQLNIMIQKINEFKSNNLLLSDLIYELEALLNILEDNDLIWKNKFYSHWADLEIAYAMTLDNEKTCLDLEEEEIVNQAIKNL